MELLDKHNILIMVKLASYEMFSAQLIILLACVAQSLGMCQVYLLGSARDVPSHYFYIWLDMQRVHIHVTIFPFQFYVTKLLHET